MEENNQNDSEQQVAAVEQPVQTAVESSASEKPKCTRRRNGRNGRAAAAQSKKSGELACGEIADISKEAERLSGSNINGYQSKKNRRFEKTDPENAEMPSEGCEKAECERAGEPAEKHEGPSFEKREFTPRTIEVRLDDKRPRRFDESKKFDGVVSYSSADEAKCKPSIFARIKAALKSIFGGKKEKKFDRNRKFDKNFKKDFRGKRKFNNQKSFNKNGGNFRRHQNRGGKRPAVPQQ